MRVAQEEPLRRPQPGLGQRGRDQLGLGAALGRPRPARAAGCPRRPTRRRSAAGSASRPRPAAPSAPGCGSLAGPDRVVQRLALEQHLAGGRRAPAPSASGPAWSCREPDSPTSASISPRRTVEVDAVQRARRRARCGSTNSTLTPRASSSGPSVIASAVAHGSTRPGCTPPAGRAAPSTSGGSAVACTRRRARGQRGANGAAGRQLARVGRVAGQAGRARSARPGRRSAGTPRTAPRVGVQRVAEHLVGGARSRPRGRRTSPATRSQTSASTDRSWLIIISPTPSSRTRSESRSRICACTITSSAVVGSSATISCGRQASAIAIITRCFWPPESWCG